jgi:hypothetical protein
MATRWLDPRRGPERRADRWTGHRKDTCRNGLGVQAIEHHRRKVSFFSTIELVNALEPEKTKGKAGQIAESLTKLDLVILDELCCLPFSTSGGALLFHLLEPSFTSAPASSSPRTSASANGPPSSATQE